MNSHLPISLFKETRAGVTFVIKVVPRAHRNEIVGVEGDAIKIRLNAPPVEGKANEALVEFVAKALRTSRSQIEIVAGHSARRKIVRVRGLTAQSLQERLSS